MRRLKKENYTSASQLKIKREQCMLPREDEFREAEF
jgi:hypothetical protein